MSAQLQVTGEAKIRDIQGPVVANSGVITALDGAASQYVRGDGTLADFPTSSGGGSSVSYYLNSSVSQGTIGGVAYRELSKDPIIGGGTDIAISSNGYVASYITDANDPDVVLVPGGNFNCEFYFSVNNNTGNPYTYAELYKYDGTTFTLLGTSVGVPEYINQGTVINPYYFAIPVATATLALTDRLAIRIYVNVDGRTVTLHTENGHLCQVVTTLSKGMVSLNNLTDQSQFLTTGTSGTDFTIASTGDTHTFNLPVASDTNTGKLSSTDWVIFNNKQDFLTDPVTGTGNTNYVPLFTGTSTIGNSIIYQDGVKIGIMNASPTTTLDVIGGGNFSGSIGALSFIKSGGTSSQFLKADGSVDSNTYLTTSSAASTYVPYTGATTFVNLGTQLFYSGGVAVENAGNGLISTDGSLSAGKGIFLTNTVSGGQWSSGTTNLVARNSGFLITRSAGGGLLIFDSAVTYDYTFPSSNGTIALTSNLSSYLPLSGGTLTGALSGTSATFSSSVQAANMSIGITPQTDKLFVYNASGTNTGLTIQQDGTGDIVRFNGNSGANRFNITQAGAATFSSSVTANGYINNYLDQGALRLYNSSTTFAGGIGTGAWVEGSATTDIAIYSANNLKFYSGSSSTSKMTITSGGNVGIGTSSPGVALEVSSAGEITRFRTSGSTNYFTFFNSAGSQIGDIGYDGRDTNILSIWNNSNGGMLFGTNGSERMRLTSDGYLLVGSTSDNGYKQQIYGGLYVNSNDNNPLDATFYLYNRANNDWGIIVDKATADFGVRLNIAGAAQYGYAVYNTDTSAFSYFVYGNGDVRNTNNSYGAISDIKNKENITDATPKLADLLKVKIRNYNLIGDDKKQIGVIAQELEEIFPNMIDEIKEKDSEEVTKSVKYSVFVPMLIKAIQEQQAQIEELKAKIK